MIDYTKYELKNKEELISLLEDKDNIVAVVCNKCFKEFELGEVPEASEFEELAKEQGKTVIDTIKVDFLCNETSTPIKLESELSEDAEDIFVISCGLGIQNVANLLGKSVYAASDTVAYRGQHGMALTATRCEACAQCYLNLTGGICPVIDCAKSLLNGQCGGAKDGKCEVDKDMDCGWQNIYNRMEEQGRVDELTNQPLEIRDYSKVNYQFINKYVKSVRENRLEGFYGGVHPTENKDFTEHLAIVDFLEPDTVVIPLSQHIGAPAEVIVEVGQVVKVGQKIGEANASVCSPIHSSVSGKVVAIEPRLHSTLASEVLSVVIKSDKQNTLHESIKPAGDFESFTNEEIIELIREKGIVGMGGACFPTCVKLNADKPIETVLVNGCECEPLLTTDHRIMLEYADDIIYGLKVIMKATDAEEGIIVIEDNKADAIELLQSKAANLDNIKVVSVKTKYPQGAEKMLVKRVLNRQVPSGGLPLDVGALVSNVSTVKAISDVFQTGMPLVERVVSVTGERINRPGNYMVKVGTSVNEIIEYCGGIKGDDVTVKLGGPMMGTELDNLHVPIIKGCNGIVAIETVEKEVTPCIQCGRCVDVCPMELKPLYYPKYEEIEDWEGMQKEDIMDCIECGCCDYICSSKINIVDKIKIGKNAIKEGK